MSICLHCSLTFIWLTEFHRHLCMFLFNSARTLTLSFPGPSTLLRRVRITCTYFPSEISALSCPWVIFTPLSPFHVRPSNPSSFFSLKPSCSLPSFPVSMFWVMNNSTNTPVWQVLPRWIMRKVDLYHLRGDLRGFETAGSKLLRGKAKAKIMCNQWNSEVWVASPLSEADSHNHEESLQHLFKKNQNKTAN